MTLDDVREYFGTQMAATNALGLTNQAWQIWAKCGHIPLKNQFLYEQITKGALKADIKHTNYKVKK